MTIRHGIWNALVATLWVVQNLVWLVWTGLVAIVQEGLIPAVVLILRVLWAILWAIPHAVWSTPGALWAVLVFVKQALVFVAQGVSNGLSLCIGALTSVLSAIIEVVAFPFKPLMAECHPFGTIVSWAFLNSLLGAIVDLLQNKGQKTLSERVSEVRNSYQDRRNSRQAGRRPTRHGVVVLVERDWAEGDDAQTQGGDSGEDTRPWIERLFDQTRPWIEPLFDQTRPWIERLFDQTRDLIEDVLLGIEPVLAPLLSAGLLAASLLLALLADFVWLLYVNFWGGVFVTEDPGEWMANSSLASSVASVEAAIASVDQAAIDSTTADLRAAFNWTASALGTA